MLHRGLAAALALLVPTALLTAETYRGQIIELSDTQLTLLTRAKGKEKADKRVLTLAAKVLVSDIGGKKECPFPDLKKLVLRRGARGLGAIVQTNDDGKVETIKADLGVGVPADAAAILEKADRIELYSLEPDPAAAKALKGTEFHTWAVLGKVVVKDAKKRKEVLDILEGAVGRGRAAKCFDPRHGIRATHGGKTVDLVICFHCGQVYFYFDPERDKAVTSRISKDMQADLDAILKASSIPLAKPADE